MYSSVEIILSNPSFLPFLDKSIFEYMTFSLTFSLSVIHFCILHLFEILTLFILYTSYSQYYICNDHIFVQLQNIRGYNPRRFDNIHINWNNFPRGNIYIYLYIYCCRQNWCRHHPAISAMRMVSCNIWNLVPGAKAIHSRQLIAICILY